MEYGLIGEKLGHSFSPFIHKELGNGAYELHALAPHELDAFMKARSFKGINVTIPYKKAVIPYLQTISAEAKKIGSVNTVVADKDGGLHGYNTDYAGFLYAVRTAQISVAGKKALVLGSGGTSLTAQAALDSLGARTVLVVSRTGEVNYQNIYEHKDTEILVNTTPVGMYPNNGQAPAVLSRFPQLSGVVDVVYNPLRTALILEAEKRGIPCTSGLPMLIAQAKAAAELFFHRAIDDGAVAAIERKMRAEASNIILIGMPGSGKTVIGQKTAQILGRRFVDADAVLEAKAGITIPEIFAKYGEESFRRLETEVLNDIGKTGGQVLSTGGGTVLRPENYAPLRQNGRIYLIKRDREKLAVSGRPLSKSPEALAEMERIRGPYYAAFADAAIQNDKTVEDAARKILEDFYENLSD